MKLSVLLSIISKFPKVKIKYKQNTIFNIHTNNVPMLQFMYEFHVNLWTAYDSLYCEKQITSSYIQSFLISYIFDRKAVINGKQMETSADIWITGFVLFCFSEWFVLCLLLLNFKLFEGRNYYLFSILCSISFTVFSQK